MTSKTPSRKRRDNGSQVINDPLYSTTKRLAFCEPQLATGASHHVLLATTPLPPQPPPIKLRRMAAPQVLTSEHPYHQHDVVFRTAVVPAAPVNNNDVVVGAASTGRAAGKASFEHFLIEIFLY